MGVKGTHLFLKKRGLTSSFVENIDSLSSLFKDPITIHVDLLGSFYPMILTNFFRHDISMAAKLLINHLNATLPKNISSLYIDGRRTKEKKCTSEKRQQRKEKDQKTTERLLRIAEGKAAQGRGISGSHIDAIFRSARRAFELTPNMMQEIFETAKEDGWSIVQCDGEADVHIGNLDLTANAVVVSGDSDLLFYENIHHILRPAKQGYLFYKKSDILELLNMTSPQWTCVGVVSGNDYDLNITGLGIATNCTLVKNIKQDTVKDILTCYLELDRVKAKNEEKIAFSKAYKIFGTKKQEFVGAVVETSEKRLLFHQNTMKSKLLKIKQLQQQQQKSAKDAKGCTSDIRFQRKWQFNKCRPLERKRINADGIATHPNEDGLRYTFKEFSEFKKASQIPSAYKMYKAKPDTLGNKKRKKEKKKKKKKKAKAEPSGRSKRKLDNAPGLSEEDMVEEPVKKRKMNESRKLAYDLKRKHPTVTLNVGNVATNIRRSIPHSKIQEKVLNTIQSIAGIMNESKKLAQMATSLLIAYVMECYPYLDYLCNKARTILLTSLVYGKDGGKVYFQNLLRCILSGNKESMDFDQIICNLLQVAKVDSDTAKQMAKIAFQLLMRCYEAEKLEYQNLDTVFGKLTLGRTLAMLSQVVDTELASHFKGRLPQLEEKVLEYGTDIKLPFCNSETMDDISRFYFTNKLIPESARFALTPLSGSKDSFIDITEEGLLEALYEIGDMNNILCGAFGLQSMNANKKDLRNAVLLKKGVLTSTVIFRLTKDELDETKKKHKHGYQATTDVLDVSSHKRYLLSGTIKTNGHELQLVAFDTSKQGEKSKKKQQSGIDSLLPSVEDVFCNTKAITEIYQDPRKVTVVGIDLGEVVTAAACAINLPTNTAATLRNLTIKRRALYQPTLKLRTIMEKEKPSAVCMAENAIGSIKNHSFSAAETLVQTWISKYGELRNFYRTRKFKQLIADGKRSRRGELDVATNALLKMIGGHMGKKRDSDEQVLFAVGLGDFNTHTKLSSLHTSFGRHFINKLRSLGYLVVGVDEFYTSKKCPRCEDFVGQVTLRRLYCPKCQCYFHRDVMAAQNIARIAQSQLCNLSRPEYLQPILGD